MKNITKTLLVVLPLLSFFAAAEVSVIVHPSNTAKIKKTDIKKIFLGKKTSFSNNEIATPVNLSGNADLRRSFNKKMLNRSSSQVASAWAKLEFTGTGTPPEERNATDILNLVASNPAMISYIDSAAVTADVKVVLTLD